MQYLYELVGSGLGRQLGDWGRGIMKQPWLEGGFNWLEVGFFLLKEGLHEKRSPWFFF